VRRGSRGLLAPERGRGTRLGFAPHRRGGERNSPHVSLVPPRRGGIPSVGDGKHNRRRKGQATAVHRGLLLGRALPPLTTGAGERTRAPEDGGHDFPSRVAFPARASRISGLPRRGGPTSPGGHNRRRCFHILPTVPPGRGTTGRETEGKGSCQSLIGGHSDNELRPFPVWMFVARLAMAGFGACRGNVLGRLPIPDPGPWAADSFSPAGNAAFVDAHRDGQWLVGLSGLWVSWCGGVGGAGAFLCRWGSSYLFHFLDRGGTCTKTADRAFARALPKVLGRLSRGGGGRGPVVLCSVPRPTSDLAVGPNFSLAFWTGNGSKPVGGDPRKTHWSGSEKQKKKAKRCLGSIAGDPRLPGFRGPGLPR